MDDRLEQLMEIQRGISFDKNLALVGSTATVLIDERVDDPDFAAIGRTVGQALDVDGVTNLRSTTELRAGDFVDVRITDALDYDLIAEIV